MSQNNPYDTAYMLDTITGFTYTCLKGEVARKIELYPVQKEITEDEYNQRRGITAETSEDSETKKSTKTKVVPTKADLLAQLKELDPGTDLNERSKIADIQAAIDLAKEAQINAQKSAPDFENTENS